MLKNLFSETTELRISTFVGHVLLQNLTKPAFSSALFSKYRAETRHTSKDIKAEIVVINSAQFMIVKLGVTPEQHY